MSTRHRTLRAILLAGDPEPLAVILGGFLAAWSWWYAFVTMAEPPLAHLGVVAAPFAVLPGAAHHWLAAVLSGVSILWLSVVVAPDDSPRRRVVSGAALVGCYAWIGTAYALRDPSAWRSTGTPVYLGLFPTAILWAVGRVLWDARQRRG